MAPSFADVPRLLDPRTWLRATDDLHTLSVTAVAALEDLHTVAQVARGLEQVEARLTARIASGEATLHEAVDVARRSTRPPRSSTPPPARWPPSWSRCRARRSASGAWQTGCRAAGRGCGTSVLSQKFAGTWRRRYRP